MNDLSQRAAPKLAAALLALAFLGAACSEAVDEVTTADTQASSESNDVADAESEEAADSSDEPADTGDSGDDGDAPADTGDSGEDEDAPADTAEDGATAAPQPQVWLPADEAEKAANTNLGTLQLADDVRDTEVLSVASGEISSLRAVVTGDRPVLLWFYAPH